MCVGIHLRLSSASCVAHTLMNGEMQLEALLIDMLSQLKAIHGCSAVRDSIVRAIGTVWRGLLGCKSALCPGRGDSLRWLGSGRIRYAMMIARWEIRCYGQCPSGPDVPSTRNSLKTMLKMNIFTFLLLFSKQTFLSHLRSRHISRNCWHARRRPTESRRSAVSGATR